VRLHVHDVSTLGRSRHGPEIVGSGSGELDKALGQVVAERVKVPRRR